jgi:hypothetical protein
MIFLPENRSKILEFEEYGNQRILRPIAPFRQHGWPCQMRQQDSWELRLMRSRISFRTLEAHE